jgi:hypothetical protein
MERQGWIIVRRQVFQQQMAVLLKPAAAQVPQGLAINVIMELMKIKRIYAGFCFMAHNELVKK